MQLPIDTVTRVVELTRSNLPPSDRKAIALAILDTELEAMEVGTIRATPYTLAEARVCRDTLAACDDDHVDTTLAAIYQVRYVTPAD